MGYVILALSILANTAAGLVLKIAGGSFEGKNKYYLLGGFALSAVSAVLYAKSLAYITLSNAVTLSSSMIIILSAFAGIYFFNEPISLLKAIGIIIICIGIFLVMKY